MMFPGAKLPFPRGSGSHSLKQWAAGAPVIGAAPVSSGRPKRPRSEGLSGSGALRSFYRSKEETEEEENEKTNPPISIRDVTKVYPGGVEALRGVSLDCAAGQVTALLGRSGCGKTTLLNLCGAMDFPTTGEVRLAGELTSTLGDAGLTQLRRHKIGFVFQFFQLLPSLTALENVELPLLLSGAKNTEQTAIERLRWVGLEDKLHALPYQLSGGQMQRVAIARALVHNPAILVADEPTGNLDTASAEIILRLLRRAADESGAAVVIATHSNEAAAIADVQVRMRDGLIE